MRNGHRGLKRCFRCGLDLIAAHEREVGHCHWCTKEAEIAAQSFVDDMASLQQEAEEIDSGLRRTEAVVDRLRTVLAAQKMGYLSAFDDANPFPSGTDEATFWDLGRSEGRMLTDRMVSVIRWTIGQLDVASSIVDQPDAREHIRETATALREFLGEG